MKLAFSAAMASLSIIVLTLGGIAAAQTSGATISGVVTDPSGAVLQGTSVTVTNVNTGVVRTTESNETGLYTVSALQPGEYEIQAATPAFNPWCETE